MKIIRKLKPKHLEEMTESFGEHIVERLHKQVGEGHTIKHDKFYNPEDNEFELTWEGSDYCMRFDIENDKVYLKIKATPKSMFDDIEKKVRDCLPSNRKLDKQKLLGKYSIEPNGKSLNLKCRVKKVPSYEGGGRWRLYEELHSQILKKLMEGIRK
ncbi:MAG: hypothetical protein PVG65_05920 [Candidatus Thorarchaeota archaeon]|jgi:hypothetical protein